MPQAFYRKWRPKTWGEVVGQEHIVQTLKNAIASDRVGHAYLFSGPRGTGKTTTARLLAKAVNCTAEAGLEKPCDACVNCLAVDDGNFLDLIEIDAASNTSVDDIRDLRDKINFMPNSGKFKVYIIDEVHMLSTAAFNALLKTLEEPPSHAIFILATTEIHKIPATVLSRCQRHEFRRLAVPVIAELLGRKAKEEGIEVDAEVLTVLARQATGSMRDAISLLDQLASTSEKIDMSTAESVLGTAASQSVVDLVNAIASEDLAEALNQIQKALDTGTDARQFSRQLVDFLRNIMLVRLGNASLVDTTQENREVMARLSQKISSERLIDALNQFNQAASDNRSSNWQPGLALEMAVARILVQQPVQQIVYAEPEPVVATTKPVRTVPQAKVDTPNFAPTDMPVKAAVAEQPVRAEGKTESPDGQFLLIQQNWRKIAEGIGKLNKGTQALVNSCRLQSIKDGCLVLVFASEILKSKMDSSANLETVRTAIQQATGLDIPVRCVVGGAKSSTGKVEYTPGQKSLVNTAIHELGGKVVDVTEQSDKTKR